MFLSSLARAACFGGLCSSLLSGLFVNFLPSLSRQAASMFRPVSLVLARMMLRHEWCTCTHAPPVSGQCAQPASRNPSPQVADAIQGVVELGLEVASPIVNRLVLHVVVRLPPARSTSHVSN